MLPFKEMWCTVFGFLSTRSSTPSFPTPTVPTPTWRLSNLLNRDIPGPAPQPFQAANPNEARIGLIIIFSFIGLALGGTVVFIFHQLWAWRARRRAEKLEKENKATGVSPGGLRSAQRTPQLSPAPSGASSAPRSRVPSGAAPNASSNPNSAQRTPQMSPAPSGTSSEPRSRVPSGAAPNASANTEDQTHNTSTNPTIEEDKLSTDPLRVDDQETIQANREETNADASQNSSNTIQATLEDPVETSNVGSISQQNPADQDAVHIDKEEADAGTSEATQPDSNHPETEAAAEGAVETSPENPQKQTQQGKGTFRPKKRHTDFPSGGGFAQLVGISGSGSAFQQNLTEQSPQPSTSQQAIEGTGNQVNSRPEERNPAGQNPRGTNNRRRGRGESTTRGRGAGRSQPRK